MVVQVLGKCFSVIRNGASIKQWEGAKGIPITRIETISDKVVNRDKLGYSNINNVKKYESYILHDGDILMSHINSEKHLGKVALYHKKENEIIIHGMNLLMLRANLEVIQPQYAYYYFLSLKFKRSIKTITKKSVNQASFTVNALKNIKIELPNIEKQNRIALILDKVNQVIVRRKKQLELLDGLTKSRFVELFGDPVENSKNFSKRNLSEYIQFMTSGSRGWSKYFSDSGKYFITIKNVKNCHIHLDKVQYVNPPDNAEAKRTKVQTGDLLISITADLGRTGVVTEEIERYGGFINQHLICIRLDKKQVNPLYIAYYMESESGKRQFQSKNQSAVKAGLNFDSINSLKILLPPIKLQNQFAAFVKETDKSRQIIQASLDETQKLFDSLMQQYFG